MIAYKIVRRKDDGLVSMVARSDAETVYAPGEKARAPAKYAARGYHLLAFNTLAIALLHFGKMYGDNLEIWTARLDGVVPEKRMPQAYGARRGTANTRGPFTTIKSIWPLGTVMAETITLLNKVY